MDYFHFFVKVHTVQHIAFYKYGNVVVCEHSLDLDR